MNRESMVGVLMRAAKLWASGVTQLKSNACEETGLSEPDVQKAMTQLAKRGLVRNKQYEDGTLAIVFITKLGFQEIEKLKKAETPKETGDRRYRD
jgi:DNA-binding MarR family transcriptional regulator